MVWMAIAASSRPSSRVAMLSPVVPIFGPTASAMRSTHQSTAHTSATQTMSAATCARPPFCALMIVVLIAPGPASRGTASGTTPESSPDSSSLASAAGLEGRHAGADQAQQALAEERRAGKHREHGERDDVRQAPPAGRIGGRGDAEENRHRQERVENRRERDDVPQILLEVAHFFARAVAALRSALTCLKAGRSSSIFK